MAVEIERKFLVANMSWQQDVIQSIHIRQGYLTETGPCSIRIRIQNNSANINIKGATLSMERAEYEYPIPIEDAQELFSQFCNGSFIEKVRYIVPYGKHKWEVDVFSGENCGLVVAEIELRDKKEVFDRPGWVAEEVTDDPRYYNVCLLKTPYSHWDR